MIMSSIPDSMFHVLYSENNICKAIEFYNYRSVRAAPMTRASKYMFHRSRCSQ